jgi:hypothetical protein
VSLKSTPDEVHRAVHISVKCTKNFGRLLVFSKLYGCSPFWMWRACGYTITRPAPAEHSHYQPLPPPPQWVMRRPLSKRINSDTLSLIECPTDLANDWRSRWCLSNWLLRVTADTFQLNAVSDWSSLTKNTEITFFKRMPNFFRAGMKAHWEECDSRILLGDNTGGVVGEGESCCDLFCFSVLESGFKLGFVVCTYIAEHMCTQFRREQNSTCAGPSGTSGSVCIYNYLNTTAWGNK